MTKMKRGQKLKIAGKSEFEVTKVCEFGTGELGRGEGLKPVGSEEADGEKGIFQ